MATYKKLSDVDAATTLSDCKILIVQDSTVRQADIALTPYEALTTDEIDAVCLYD